MSWSVNQVGGQVTLSRDEAPAENFVTFREGSDVDLKKLNELARLLSKQDAKPKGK